MGNWKRTKPLIIQLAAVGNSKNEKDFNWASQNIHLVFCKAFLCRFSWMFYIVSLGGGRLSEAIVLVPTETNCLPGFCFSSKLWWKHIYYLLPNLVAHTKSDNILHITPYDMKDNKIPHPEEGVLDKVSISQIT